MKEIKAIVLDIDGVIVGDKPGYNMPHPPKVVIDAIKEISQKIPVTLCTGKFHQGIVSTIKLLELDNLHVADNGAVIFNPFSDKYIIPKAIDNKILEGLFDKFDTSKYFFEVYTKRGIFVQQNVRDDLVDKHSEILGLRPNAVPNIKEKLNEEILKVIFMNIDMEIHRNIESTEGISVKFTSHPYLNPDKLSLITAPGVSKGHGFTSVAQDLGIEMDSFLGVGDSLSDFDFIKLCGTKAAMGNSEQELKDVVLENDGFVGGNVNEDGILSIFRHFDLIK